MWTNIDPRKLSPFKVADARSNERPHVSTSDNVILDDDRAKIIKNLETLAQSEKINYFCTRIAAKRRHKN